MSCMSRTARPVIVMADTNHRVRTIPYARDINEAEWRSRIAEMKSHEVRTTGRHGIKMIGRGGLDLGWSRMIDALVDHGVIDRRDQTEACKSEKVSGFHCPHCGSDSGYAWRGEEVRVPVPLIACGRKCRRKDILTDLGIREDRGVPPQLGERDREPLSLPQAHRVFRRWLGEEYDLDALDAVLATVAVERLDGDPVWLLIISGSGNAKTETVGALSGVGAQVVSTISSDGALLSGTNRRDRDQNSTGGLLREMGEQGLLVIKDVTSILSMNRDLRGSVLAALREVHDGQWTRKIGADGGRSLSWSGRIAVVGAVTTAWDAAHSVIASMGDRFVVIRMDSTTGRQAAGRRAIGNTGAEQKMRAELAEAVAGLITGMRTDSIRPDAAEIDALLAAGDLVTLARTGVEFDYRGDVIDAHAPEMPTRFVKELTQIFRGAVAIGLDRRRALRLALRCARDSMPPLRLAIIEDVAANPSSTATDVRKRLNKPRATIDRQLQALHMLGVLDCIEQDAELAGKTMTRWRYLLRKDIDPGVLSVPDLSVRTRRATREEDQNEDERCLGTDKSGIGRRSLA